MAESLFSLRASATQVHSQEPDWKQCLCHVMSVSGSLIPFTAQSWMKLRESAELCQDAIDRQLKEHWDEGSAGGYHRPCYQTYTNKILIKRLLTKRNLESLDHPSQCLS